MKCPNDQTEMEKGSLTGHGSNWIDDPNYDFGIRLRFSGKMIKTFAYRCPECGKIELTGKQEEK